MMTDGNRIYFEEAINGNVSIAQVSVNGGETSLVPVTLPSVGLLDYSVSRSELLISSGTNIDNALWRVPLPSGSPSRTGITAYEGNFSPDGKRIAYSKYDGSLHVANFDGSDNRGIELPPKVAAEAPFTWVDDRRFLLTLVDKEKDAKSSLWEMNADTGEGTVTLRDEENLLVRRCCARLIASGEFFVFTQWRNRMPDLWAASAGGSFPLKKKYEVQLTSGPLSYLYPTASLDGKRIFVLGSLKRSQLTRYDAGTKQFVPYLGGISAAHVAFSNDGQWVTYVDYPTSVLWRSRVDGSEKLQLTSDDMLVVQPRWSPDGKQIAFTGFRPGTPWRMYTVRPEGGAPPEPILMEEQSQLSPAWSPDGKSIAFGRIPGREAKMSLHQLDLETHHVTDIPGTDGMYGPNRSRDGRYLLSVEAGATIKLKIFDFSTKKWSELFQGGVADFGFSADDKFIFYTDQDKQAMFRIRLSDHKVDQIADLHSIDQPTLSYWPAWTGLAPDGSPLLMRDLGTREIYALELEQ